jgi:hypothetical protein
MTTLLTSPRAYLDSVPAGRFVRVSELPGSDAAARAAASRAAHRGDLVHVRKGLYYKGENTRYGMTGPTDDAVAAEVLGTKGVGPAGYSAARALGVTTQVPPRPEYAVVVHKPEPLDRFTVHSRANAARLDLTALEIALLEVLRAPKALIEGGWKALVGAVRNLLKTSKIRLTEVATAVRTERNHSVREGFNRLRLDLTAA